MDIINEVQVIENDIEDVKTKCNKIQCNYIYDAINAVMKLFKDFSKCILKRKNI